MDVPVGAAIEDIRRWLTHDARFIAETGDFDLALIDRLRRADLPIDRFTTGVPSLHPQVDSFSTLWEAGKGLTFRTFRRDNMGALRDSPLFTVYNDGVTVRCRLEGPPPADETSILAELRAAGITDYVAIPLPFSDGSIKAMTFGTRAAGGFGNDQVAALESLRHEIAVAAEIRYLRHMARTLMDTYVGPVAGRRVLDGAIKRGTGETIRAAIWFCDLRGFTSLSEELTGDAVIDLLNDYFDVVTAAIEAERGEILKFIGDAVLAIFAPAEGEDEAVAAGRALAAAQAAVAALAERNTARAADGKRDFGLGIALHFGDVHYGNVGGANRLDFTVIRPAVNLASRIEALTRQVDRTVLVSSAFARLHGGAFDDLGAFALKGVAHEETVFAPRGP